MGRGLDRQWGIGLDEHRAMYIHEARRGGGGGRGIGLLRQSLVGQSVHCADSYITHMLCNTAAMFSSVNPIHGVCRFSIFTPPSIVLYVFVHSC